MATAMAAGGKKKGDEEENDKDDDEQDEGRSMRLEHDLVVITGKGLHSEDAPVLASEARGYLRTAFAPPLEIREVRGNAGRFAASSSRARHGARPSRLGCWRRLVEDRE